MYEIALKMLFGDRSKYLMLVCSIAFATLLTTQQSAIFLGLMRWTTATIRNTSVPIWVMDPQVSQVNEVKALRDTDINRVRSVQGVDWAVPFFFSLQQVRLPNGDFKTIQLFGLDSSTLVGAPSILLTGNLNDLRRADAVIIDEIGIRKLNNERGVELKVGDTFELNDNQLIIIGICKVSPSFFGYPQVYTTYDRALEIIPKTRQNLSYILVNPKPIYTPLQLAKKIKEETHLKALTEEQFFWDTIYWFFKNTSIPISFGTTVTLGFIVGVAVAGQTFYTFILENLGNLGALKAMGASNALLCRMLLLQAFCSGCIGYGIGLGFAGIFGFLVSNAAQFPYYLPYQVLVFVFFLIILICSFSAFVGIRRINKIDPAEVFRA